MKVMVLKTEVLVNSRSSFNIEIFFVQVFAGTPLQDGIDLFWKIHEDTFRF